MEQMIPAFPLGLVCFPGEIQNLHIFEQRYRDLINDCIEENISFALVPYVNNKAFHLATEVKLHEVSKKYPDGKFDVSLIGTGLIKVHRLLKVMKGKSYPAVKMSPFPWEEEPNLLLSEEIVDLIKRLYSALSLTDEVPPPSVFLVRDVVHKIGLTLQQELSLLAIAEEKGRQQLVLRHLQEFVPTVEKAQNLRMKAVLNGHFKNIDPANF